MKNYLLLLKKALMKNKNACISNDEINENQDLVNKITLCRASELGKIIVNKCLDQGIKVNTQKLHKLLVLVQIECIKDSEFPIFDESIEIWDDCGYVIRKVDEDFRQYSVRFEKKFNERMVLLHSEMKYIDDTLKKYGNLNSFELNEVCLKQEGWLSAYNVKVLKYNNK